MVGAIYEVVRLVDSPCGNQFTTVTTSTLPRATTTAIATSGGDIIIFDHRNGQSTTKRIPWTQDEHRKPVSLAFSPTAEWLCVASEDGTLFVVPISSHLEPNSACDHRFRTDDVLVLPPNGSRARPTALVWWQTIVGDASLAIVGTELGELCFIELSSGREVGGTYITVPVRELHLCRDNSLDTVFLLITGPDDRQWRLVLEQRSTQYLFPLEHISPEWAQNDNSSESFHGSHPPPAPRSRLLGLKQMSVEKLQMLKQRLSESRTGTRRRPQTENKGVDTCDIDEIMYTSTPEQTMTASTTSVASGNDINEPPAFIPSNPESMGKYILDSLASPQYAKERYLLACHCKENNTVLVYSTDLETTPLYVFKIIPNIDKIVLHDEMIFLSDAIDRRKLTIVSTFFSSSSKLDGSLDSKVNPVIQEVELPEDQEIIGLFPTPAFKKYSQPLTSLTNERDEALSAEDEELSMTSHTWPSGCIIVTRTALYICQTRSSIESLFMELVLKLGDIDSANKLGVIFSLDPKLFELAADIKLRSRNFAAAIALYKHSRCPHVKCSIKFAAQGLVNEFLTYQGTLTTGVSGPDLGLEERRNLATLAILCHLQQLCAPPHEKPPTTQHQHALRNLLIFLRDNHYYDEVVALSFMAGCWRWESLQYLSTVRGLHLEKLQALLSKQMSPIIDALINNSNVDPTKLPLTREREAGYLYCISDPELREVLFLRPSIAHKHMSLVLRMLPNLEVSILSRLAYLYNPTHPAIKAFLNTGHTHSKKHQAYPTLSSFNNGSTGFLSFCDEIISLDAFIEVFLAIVIKLNEKRRWKYNPTLLSKNIELPIEVPNTPVELITKNVLSGGFSHSAVIIGESLYTWGLPDYGVLGHGPQSTSNNKLLQGITLLLNDQQDMLGSSNGSHGILGNSGFVPSVTGDNNVANDGSEPRRVSFFRHHKVLSVVTGKNHMLAITDQGVYGWGSSKYGQVGCGSTGRYPRPSLIMELEGKNVVAVACGQFHSLAVTKDGKLYTWGWGVHGQLGHGNVEDQHRPKLVKKLKNKHVVVACGGYAHSVAMTADGAVFAWGCGTYGQCGNGSIQKISKPQQVHLPGAATHLTSGYFQNIAVTRDNVVLSWGSNPACLRVQAQLQRRARMQQAQQNKRTDVLMQEDVFSQVKDFQGTKEENACSREYTSPCEEQRCTCEEENGIENSNSHEEIKEKENMSEEMHIEDKQLMVHDGAITQKDDLGECQGDEITTLAEETSYNKEWDGIKPSFIISPEPSPEKLTGNSLSSDSAIIGHEDKREHLERIDNEKYQYTDVKKSSNSESSDLSVSESVSSSRGPQTITANTVPSCDPNDLGHLVPRQVEMPDGFGVVRQVAAGNQHALLLTTHGALYAWGRNMSGQLGTGSRREVLAPTRILDDAYVTNIACGADFTLARDSQGKLWGWGSNYYSQLSKCTSTIDEKGNSGRVFMLRTSKRVLKVPHSVQSNCESPQIINGLPLNPIESSPYVGSHQHELDKRLNETRVLCRLHLSEIEGTDRSTVSSESGNNTTVDEDDGCFGALTLHTALIHLHSIYNTNNIINMLQECRGHQALATVYSLDRQYSLAMHHQLHALFNFTQQQEQDNHLDQQTKDSKGGSHQSKISLVEEAWQILDHYLQLQTTESQVGMRGVLQEGISQWLQHALPTPQLEDLLLQHLPKTVYPLALLLFGDGSQGDVSEDIKEDPAMQVLSQLSTKFCVNLCSSVINHLHSQTGETGAEYIEALSRLSGAAAVSSGTAEASSSMGDDPSQVMDKVLSSLATNTTAAITINKTDVDNLAFEEATNTDKQEEKLAESDRVSTSAVLTSQEERAHKRKEKDSVLFTCGHHFTRKEFKRHVLPQLETSVMSVPGLLGKTARVLLDQYHSEQPELACPHCVLAHLTIKITKTKSAI